MKFSDEVLIKVALGGFNEELAKLAGPRVVDRARRVMGARTSSIGPGWSKVMKALRAARSQIAKTYAAS